MAQFTSAGLGQFDELQDRVVRGIRLVASIRMPSVPDVRRPVFPQVLCGIGGLVGGDDVDIRVLVRIEVGQRVDVQR